MEQRTPKQMCTDDQAALARLLRGWMHEDDLDQEDLARMCGVPPQRVQQWCTPGSGRTPNVAHLRLFPRALWHRVTAWLTEDRHAALVDELEPARGTGDHLTTLHSLLREGADVTSLYAASLADGVVDPQERRQLVKEVREDIDVLRAFLRRLEQDEASDRALSAPGGRA